MTSDVSELSLALQPADKPPHSLARLLDLVQPRGEAAAHETFAPRAKRAAGHASDFLLVQQAHGKLLRREAGGGDVRKRVERSARQVAEETNLVERVHDVIAPEPILL